MQTTTSTNTISKATQAANAIAFNPRSRYDNPRKPRSIKRERQLNADPLKYSVLSDQTIEFTKDAALAFLKMSSFEGERPIRESHVQNMYDEWKSGRFLWSNIILASAVYKKVTYRINGQHTAWMRVNIDENIKPQVRSIQYSVETADQLRALYASYDRGAPRSVSHIGRVLLIDTKAVEGVATTYIGHLIAGYRLFSGQPSSKLGRVAISEIVASITKKHSKLFNTVGQYYASYYGENTWIRRASILGALLATFDKDQVEAIKFWTPVITGVGLASKQDRRWQLRRYVENHSIIMSRGGITQNQLYNTCIRAWNLWREKTPVTTRLVTINERPKVK